MEDQLRGKKGQGQNNNGKAWFPLSVYNMQIQSACAPIAQDFKNVPQVCSLHSLGAKDRMPLSALWSDHPS